MIGKWHLGFCSWSYTPLYRGFDSFYGMYLGAGDHYTHKTARILDLHDNETPVENKDGVYSMNLFAEVWNNNRFLFIYLFTYFFRLAISPTWSYGEKKCSTFYRKKSDLDLDCRAHFFCCCCCDKCIWNESYMRTAEMKSSEEWSSQLWTQFLQLRKRSPKTIHDFNGICALDPAIPVRRSNQLKLWSHWCWEQVMGSVSRRHGFKSRLSPEFFSGFSYSIA